MSNESVIEEIELNMKEAEKLIELGDMLVKLESNRAFKKVIMEGYLEKEAVRMTHLKAHPNMQSEEQRALLERGLDGIAQLVNYFNTVQYRAKLAADAIKADSEELDRIRNEDDDSELN